MKNNKNSGSAQKGWKKPQKMEERSMGASRDLTSMFLIKKKEVRTGLPGGLDPQRERFKPKSNILQNKLTNSGDLQQHYQNEDKYGAGGALPQSDSQRTDGLGTGGQQKFMAGTNYEEVIQNLPPVWIDLQDDVDDNLIQIKHQMQELRPLKAQRFGNTIFDEKAGKVLDEQISQLVSKITRLLKVSEEKIKEMARADPQDLLQNDLESAATSHQQQESQVKKAIIQNVQQTYREKLRIYAMELKGVEKEYLDKMVEMEMNKDPDSNVSGEQLQQQILMQKGKSTDELDYNFQYRNEKIPQIIRQMNELSDLYKEMSRLVIEQGTILDRIDQNVFEARYQVNVGKDMVENTLKKDTSPRAQACIVFLVQAIVICVIFLALKHT